jgi:hypothetical protein
VLKYCETGDDEGRSASGSNREAESTDAQEKDGPPCSSDEGAVMALERGRRVSAVAARDPDC